MAMYKKSQIVILSLVAGLPFASPFLSASIRLAYHYFIVNLLIVALGAEAGLLSFSSSLKPDPLDEEEIAVTVVSSLPGRSHKPRIMSASFRKGDTTRFTTRHDELSHPSPSIFVIGDEENINESIEKKTSFHQEEDEEVEVVGEIISEQELYAKAEAFIGNFYEQLKMQRRQESWNRVQDAASLD